MKSEYEPQLGDEVVCRTGDGRQEGRIVGRTLEGYPKFDVDIKRRILPNVPLAHIERNKEYYKF